MFAFRNHSSPTLSQLLRFNRSPVTITVLAHPLGADGRRAQPATTESVVDLLHGVIDQLERSDARVLPDHRRYERIVDAGPGIAAHAGAFALGVAAALLAAGLLGAGRPSGPTLTRD